MKGFFVFFQEHPEKEAYPSASVSYFLSTEIKDPEWWSGSCMSAAFPPAFVVYFAEKSGGRGEVNVLSVSN